MNQFGKETTGEDRHLLQDKLLQVTREELGIHLGLNDNLFDVGADSVKLVRLAAALEKTFERTVRTSDLFAYPTVRKLAESWLGDGRIDLEAMALPASFAANGQGAGNGLLEVALDEEVSGGLYQIAQDVELEPFDILTGLMAFVLGDLAEASRLPLQTMHGIADVVTQVSLDMAQAEDVGAFLAHVAELRAAGELRYPLHHLSKVALPKGDELLAFVFDKSYKTTHADLLSTYDLVLEIEQSADRFTLACEYNGRRVNKDRVRDLLEGIAEVAGALASQYHEA